MIQSSRGEQKALTKQSAHPTGTSSDVDRAQTASRSWSSSALKNPRIVRVSRSFGGKDRHSKVRTIRGLRDRRVRLSVPTAIQLYDLQDKLGLNQPSKVVDWLLNAAQHEIDKLPPLEMLQLGGDHQHLFDDQLPPQPNLASSSSQPFDFVCIDNAVNDHYKRMDSEKAQAPANFLKRSKESNQGNAVDLGHHGFALENSNPNNYCNLESSASNNTNNYLISQGQDHPGCHHPIAILASYMAAASSYNVSVAAAGSASQNASSGALKIMHHETSNIIAPSLMAHDLHRDSAAASRVLHQQYQ